MPLLTVPREMALKILMALAPDYAALCRAVQTCAFLRNMEATDKEVLWKHMCETLIKAQTQSAGPYTTPAFAPRVMAMETQTHLVMDSKAAVRLNHGHVRFGLPGTINAFTVQALEDEFDFLLEVQYRDPCQNLRGCTRRSFTAVSQESQDTRGTCTPVGEEPCAQALCFRRDGLWIVDRGHQGSTRLR